MCYYNYSEGRGGFINSVRSPQTEKAQRAFGLASNTYRNHLSIPGLRDSHTVGVRATVYILWVVHHIRLQSTFHDAPQSDAPLGYI